jgi:Anti-sigma-K factor rskA
MSAHIFDELPLLLMGEADRNTVALAADHLRECRDCQQELVAALVAHASLSSAARFAPTMRVTLSTEPTDEPTKEPDPLPDMSSLFSMVKQEAREPRHSVLPPKRRPVRARWLAAAAVAGVVVGGGAVVAAQNLGGSPSARTVQLAAFDQGTVAASAKVVGNNEVRVDASSLPKPASGTNYEVWLTNTARTSLQPVGWVGADGKTSLQLPTSLLDEFTNLEVSVQKISEPYLFSKISVLRGAYR